MTDTKLAGNGGLLLFSLNVALAVTQAQTLFWTVRTTINHLLYKRLLKGKIKAHTRKATRKAVITGVKIHRIVNNLKIQHKFTKRYLQLPFSKI